MKIKCNRDALSDALQKVSRAASLRSTLTATEGVYLRAEESSLFLCCYNLELGISTKILANVYEEGSIVLSSRLFCEIVRRMPGDEVEITCGEQFVTWIKASDAKYSIVGTSADDFPELPVVNGQRRMTIEQGLLKSMIGQTIFAVSDNDARPTCMGSLFEISEDKIRIVALDGFRLAIRTEPTKSSFSGSFIVPKKTLEELLRLLDDDGERSVEFCATHRHIEFTLNGFSIISRLIEGDFMEYNNALPKNNDIEIKVNTRRMLDASERMGLLISDTIKSPVRCTFGDNCISFKCRTAIGSAADRVPAEAPNEPVEIGFNNRYLLDAFRYVPADEMRLRIGTPVSPVEVLPLEGDSFLFLLLPVKLHSK